MELDSKLIDKICPKFSEYWRQCVMAPQTVKTKAGNIQFEDLRNRKSGEMGTSCCNTFLNKMIIEYSAHQLGLTEDEYDYFTEGDDGVVASD